MAREYIDGQVHTAGKKKANHENPTP